jgi:hypothetical protein
MAAKTKVQIEICIVKSHVWELDRDATPDVRIEHVLTAMSHLEELLRLLDIEERAQAKGVAA